MGCLNLADEKGFFILQNRLLGYITDEEEAKIVLPRTVTMIERDWNWKKKKVHLEMPIHCPV